MSKQIDLTQPLSDEDRAYLIQRGREYDVEQSDAMFRTAKEQQVPHTGDVGTTLDSGTNAALANQTQTVETTAASAAAAAGMPGIVTADDPGELEANAEALQPPYDAEGVTKKQLIAEIQRRNALPENAEYEDIPTSGSKDDLVARLNEDDELSE